MTVAGGLGEVDRGGPAFNLMPKTGGNKFGGDRRSRAPPASGRRAATSTTRSAATASRKCPA